MARVLIADDEAILTMYLEDLLGTFGHVVVDSVSSGQEAIDSARVLLPDIIIMDISMPGELTGIEAAGIIRSELGIPSIFMTAHSDGSILEKSRQVDPYGYLIKPVQNIGTKIVLDSALGRLYAERKLKENEERFSDIVFSMADWVWETDENGRYSYAAGNVFEILGYTPEELIGKTPCDLSTEETAEDFRVFFMDRASRKESFFNKESWMMNKNGSLVCIQSSGLPLLDKDGRLKGYRGINKDISLSKNTSDALKEIETRLLSVMDSLNIGLTLISPDMEVLSSNHTMESWFPRDGFPDKSKCYHVYRSPLQSEPCPDCTVVLNLKDGLVHEATSQLDTGCGSRHLRRISLPVKNHKGEIFAVVVFLVDITENLSPNGRLCRIF